MSPNPVFFQTWLCIKTDILEHALKTQNRGSLPSILVQCEWDGD